MHELSQGDELRFALRSWCKFMNDPFDVVIVGDRPKWYNGNHIQTGSIRGTTFARCHDITSKLYTVVSNPNITDSFIYSYDDVYLIAPCGQVDFEKLIAVERMEAGYVPKHGSDKWKKLLHATISMFDQPVVYNYETHLPRIFSKEWLNRVLNTYNFKQRALLVSTIYYNEFFEEPDVILVEKNEIKAGIYRRMSYPQIENELRGKKIMNHSENAYNGDMKKMLAKLFPEKCKFEI